MLCWYQSIKATHRNMAYEEHSTQHQKQYKLGLHRVTGSCSVSEYPLEQVELIH